MEAMDSLVPSILSSVWVKLKVAAFWDCKGAVCPRSVVLEKPYRNCPGITHKCIVFICLYLLGLCVCVPGNPGLFYLVCQHRRTYNQEQGGMSRVYHWEVSKADCDPCWDCSPDQHSQGKEGTLPFPVLLEYLVCWKTNRKQKSFVIKAGFVLHKYFSTSFAAELVSLNALALKDDFWRTENVWARSHPNLILLHMGVPLIVLSRAEHSQVYLIATSNRETYYLSWVFDWIEVMWIM